MRTMKKLAATIAVVSAITMTAACGSDDSADAASGDTSATPMESESPSDTMESESPMEEESGDAMDPAANLVGPGCEGYAEQVPDGAGSVEGMAADPVAVAASNNPLLKTLTAAVSGELNPKVDLVDTLNGDEFTVFAPVDDAFAQLPKKTVKTLGTPKGAETLSAVLTYHVVPGQMTPDEIAGTTQTTVQGGDVEITGSGDSLKVNDANVICGGVQTANATVYLIDAVLMPQM
jgi:uncharacterized surface protein with fasciclin (FAS1) repeats